MNTAQAITAVYDVLKADADNATKYKLIEDMDYVLSVGLIPAAEKSVPRSDERQAWREQT